MQMLYFVIAITLPCRWHTRERHIFATLLMFSLPCQRYADAFAADYYFRRALRHDDDMRCRLIYAAIRYHITRLFLRGCRAFDAAMRH